MIEIDISSKEYFEERKRPHVFNHDTELLTMESRFILNLIERWGMVQGKDGGEDSAGRAKLELMDEQELVDRAFLIADLAFNKLRANDDERYIVNLPSIAKMKEIVKAKQIAKDEQERKELLEEF